MKTLYLMRHADTENPHPDGLDHSRLLTNQGRTQAAGVRDFLSGRANPPDHAISSDSFRTKETAKIIKKGDIGLTRDLYLANAVKLLNAIQAVEQKHDSLLVVAHNPGIAELAMHLSGDHPDVESFPPATVAIFTAEIDDWYDLEPETVFFEGIFRP